MDVSHLLTSFEAALTPLVIAKGGQISIASDPDHVCEILALSPAGWRVILSFSSSTAVDPDFSPGINRIEFNVTVQAARGLNVSPGADTYLPNATGRDPILTLCETVSQWLRGMSGDHPDIQDKGIREISRQWLQVEPLNTRQINMMFALKIASEKPINVPVVFSPPLINSL